LREVRFLFYSIGRLDDPARIGENAGMESEWIRWLAKNLGHHPGLKLGIGDDAAILRWQSPADVVVAVDLVADGTDFFLEQIDPRRAGRKSLAINLSDLAAMAAEPIAAVVALLLPREGGMGLARQMYEGLLPLAEEFGVAIAGGDTNSWDGRLVASVTVIGRTHGRAAWTRSGARPGDRLLVTGSLGGSILGKHLDFVPRVAEALALAQAYEVHAAIDVSDGLSLDLSRVASASGCGAVLDLDRIPVSESARSLSEQEPAGPTPLERALEDGEDFELLLAVPPATAATLAAACPLPVALTEIGEFIDAAGLWARWPDGQIKPLAPRGYEHVLK
jgi:thiamine-monophosphate kinase